MVMVIWHLMQDNFECVLLPDQIPPHIPHKNSIKSHTWELDLGAVFLVINPTHKWEEQTVCSIPVMMPRSQLVKLSSSSTGYA